MRIVLIIFLSAFISACFNPGMKVDGRMAIEQQLTREAIFQAIHQLPIFKGVLDGRWKIAVVSPDVHDDSWTHAQLRQRLVSLGADVSTNAAEDVPLVEAVVQFAGSDNDSFIIGLPIPGTMGTSSIGFFHDDGKRGRAQIQLNFWTNDGKLIAQTPDIYAETHYSDVTFLTFIGPFSFTNLDDVDSYGRFITLGEDTWELAKQPFMSNDIVVKDAWITPKDKHSHK